LEVHWPQRSYTRCARESSPRTDVPDRVSGGFPLSHLLALALLSNSGLSALESVLIVDDNRSALMLLGQLLESLGVKRVYPVATAEEALEVLEEESFSIILSDYRLEGMDGVSFLKKLRESGNTTPVMILSGAPDQQDIIRASTHARVDFFPKPFRIAELREAMERLLAA